MRLLEKNNLHTDFERLFFNDMIRLNEGKDAKHFPMDVKVPDFDQLLKTDLFVNKMPEIPDTIEGMYHEES